MKKYIGTKMIQAKPMNRGEYNKYRGWEIPSNENPTDEGYLVKYEDGYESWSPKGVFEKAYREYAGQYTLPGTALLMQSEDYKDRFKAEYYQVFVRFVKLKAMLENWDKDELDFEPTCPYSTYELQIKAMRDYISVLEARAVMENIDL